MGPLDKYQKYSKVLYLTFLDRFPWKFMIHILLVIVTTSQVLLLNYTEGQHFRTHQILFYRLFFDGGDPYLDYDFHRFKHIFQLYDDPEDEPDPPAKKTFKKRLSTKKYYLREDPDPDPPGPEPEPDEDDDEDDDPDTLVEIVQWSVNNYYKLLPENDEKMLDVYTPAFSNDTRCFTEEPPEDGICPVRLDAQYLDQEGYKNYNSTILLSKDEYWLFTNETLPELKSFIQNVTMFTMTYFVRVNYPDTDSLSASCFDWTIT